MTRRLFGTDGIRGTANRHPMTAEVALSLAMATARQFRRGDHLHRVIIGKDTRLSGYLLEPALTAGFVAMGMDVILVGPVPTPAIAMLTRSLRCDLGVMVSASHNPYEDNGIKLFGPDGYKLSDAVETAIERAMDADLSLERAGPDRLGRAQRYEDARGRYIEAVKASFPRGLTLDGLKVVVDCAHGAAYRVAPQVLFELGAEVIAIGDQPNGKNINDGCGATAPEALCDAVRVHGADLGIALDGDADRVILSDEAGRILDGDQLMGLIARHAVDLGEVRGRAVVSTVMSNLGLERYLKGLGLGLVRTPVGDRYVVEAMRERGCNIGGEQSGHIVLADHGTTGDGLVAGLQMLAVMRKSALPASEAAHVFDPFPQVLRSVRYEAERFNGGDPLTVARVKMAITEAERALGPDGRLVVRKSGTEPKIRVMAEGPDEARVVEAVDQVIGAVETATAVTAEAAE